MTGKARGEYKGEVILSSDGRAVVRFTTASGVRAIVDTSISQEALAKFARSLRAQIARRARLTAAGPRLNAEAVGDVPPVARGTRR